MPATTSERKGRCPDRGVMSHVVLSMLPTLPRAGCGSFIATVLLFGCGGGGDGGAAAPDATVPVAPADAAPDAGVAEQAAAFCRAQAQAKCAWAFACESLSAGDRAGVLGLGGADETACTEAAASSSTCTTRSPTASAIGTTASTRSPASSATGRSPAGTTRPWVMRARTNSSGAAMTA